MREDWVEKELGEVCQTTSGGTPSRKNASYYEGTIPWVKSGELNSNIILETEEHISEDALKNSSAKIFPKGSILIALYGATIGKLAYLGIDAASNQAVCAIFKNELFESGFLFNFLFFKRQKLVEQGMGGAQPNISQTILKKLKLPIPPLPEQRAIVAKIEELFSDLDNGIANLKKAQAQLKVYRQAVLKKAFVGLDEVPFDELVTSFQNGMAKRKGSEGSEIKVLRLADITNLKIDNASPRSIVLTAKELKKFQLYDDDLLVIRVNGSIDLVGRFIHVTKKDESETWAFCDHLIRVTLDKERSLPKFYFYYFQLPEVRKFIHQNMVSSAGQNTVSQGTVKAIPVPTTSLEEQYQIIQEIESRLSVCDKMEESITESLEKAEALRQSILKKAFEGKLLTEAELQACCQQSDWEPAAKLLERIKGENNKS